MPPNPYLYKQVQIVVEYYCIKHSVIISGYCYQMMTESKTWWSALSDCARLDSYLTMIKFEAEDTFITGYISLH